MLRRLFLMCGLVASAAACSTPASPSNPSERCANLNLHRFEFVQPKWGAAVRIVLYASNETTARHASDAVFSRFDELGGAFNDYDPQSEVSLLSRQTESEPMIEPARVSADLFAILLASKRAHELSSGAFDITVGPYTRLWRRSRDMGVLPTAERLAIAKRSVGFDHVKLITESREVQLLAPGMRLDVDGLAAGFAIEEALNVLAKHGIKDALVDGSGEVAARGAPPGQAGWRVGVQTLDSPNQMTGQYVLLRNSAVSTSGDTYRYVEIEGKKYSHIIDPRTGLGLTNRIGVTATAPDGTTADWLSTAVSVLGVVKGLELVERLPGAAARITVLEDGKPRVYESARWRSMLADPGAPVSGDVHPVR